MEKIISQESIDFLQENNVSFHYDLSQIGINLGEKISFNNLTEIEPYVGFWGGGRNICEIGSFSYSNSRVDVNLSIGRYCSISWGLQMQSYRHPYEFVSTSPFTHSRNTSFIKKFITDENIEYNNFKEQPNRK